MNLTKKKRIEDIEILKPEKLISQKKIYLEKESDEINPMDMSEKMDFDEREQISKNDEETVSGVIDGLKVGKSL